ncbi:MAG: phosphate/phosphite/phosphonate ABC transporter substrate-binding protein [Deltaproteobacteria bacterium]|nr:phosphate/phosphite/phosphonate ABC transporter substrate-binding protein [Deltaproteobacteria bacterium]
MMCWYKRLSVLRALPLFLLVAVAFGHPLAAQERLLVFGRVQENPVRAIRDRQGFVDYVAKKLAPLGFTGGRILVVDKVGQLARVIREGKVDFFHDSVVPTMVLSKWSGSVPILRQWKFGEPDYYSVILVKKDSGINTLSDLKGKVIAFDEPHSTSAHILPRMLLTEKRLKLVQIIPPAGRPEPDAVGFIHGSDDNAPHLLVLGKVDAAATSHREFEILRPEVRDGLKIIARSKSVPRLLISIPKDLDPKIATALRETLLTMNKDPEGQEAMNKQQQTTGIDEIPPGSLEQLKDIQRFIFSSLGKQVDSW